MQNQFLPIGSVCTLINNNKKVMIIGYNYSIYNGIIKTIDYIGCTYPEGLLLPNMITTFMNNEINKIDFMGYMDDTYTKFTKGLVQKNVSTEIPRRESNQDEKLPIEQNETKSYRFDENGVVIFDPFANKYMPSEVSPSNYKFDAMADARLSQNSKESVISEKTANAVTSNQYEFDENGIIIVDHTNENKTSTSNENTLSVNNVADTSKQLYEFDENGVIIKDNTVPA